MLLKKKDKAKSQREKKKKIELVSLLERPEVALRLALRSFVLR